MDALNRRRNNLIAGAVLIFFALAYYSLIYRYGLNLADEGNVALISQRLMCGERPFHDVSLGYNVLWFYPVSILFKLFGTNLLLMRAYFYALSTASGLIAFALFRRLDSPLWLAYIQGLLVISITGPYFKAYIPLLILANLFALTLFLTSLRKRLVGIASGILLGTTYLIRIDFGFFFTAIWCGVVALHALLLDRRVGLNLLVAANLIIGTVAVHLPFIYDAYNRDFLRPFLGQYAEVGAMILRPLLPRRSPSMTNRYRPGEFKPVSDAQTLTDESKRSATERSAAGLRRRSFKDIFLKSPKFENRLLAIETYSLPTLIGALLITGLCLVKRLSVDRWLLFSVLLGGSLTAFPQFFFFRPDLPHLIEFMSGGMVALACAGWLLWSSLGKTLISSIFVTAIALVELTYLALTLPNPYGGTFAIRGHRHINFRGANGVDVFLNKSEYQEANALFAATVMNSTKNDYVICYPYLPGVNFIADRRTFQNFLYIDNLIRPANWDRLEIARIQKRNPAVIVIDDWKINGTEESRFSHWAKETADFIAENYRMVTAFKEKKVFVRLIPSADLGIAKQRLSMIDQIARSQF